VRERATGAGSGMATQPQLSKIRSHLIQAVAPTARVEVIGGILAIMLQVFPELTSTLKRFV
jgi:hypothetical protein